jgi:hypothetical protein
LGRFLPPPTAAQIFVVLLPVGWSMSEYGLAIRNETITPAKEVANN